MVIVGCDFHPGWQQVAVFDSGTGEIRELQLRNSDGEAKRFYEPLRPNTTDPYLTGPPLIVLRVAPGCPRLSFFTERVVIWQTLAGPASPRTPSSYC